MKLKGIFSTLAACALLTASVAANATIITVDNTDAGFTSSGLTYSTYESGFIGSNYMADARNVSGDFAIWDPTSSTDWVAGIWNVEMLWTTGPTRASNAAVTIDSGSTVLSTTVNQLLNGSVWNDLGDYSFDLSGAFVKLDDSNSTSGQNIIADAVRFTFVSAADSISAPTDVPAPGTLLVLLAAAAGIFRLRRK
ncbi:PEP-CTERM sorting domain-containing protein [Paraglaciecola sp. L1A13]|uniref:golvesin C-terminal-like domain-containing protein n=1 Tax=Paraglaciecola sp. L1A13 TaxID=2686359 RepID=UPI00131E900D|nr:PEP-CTERM sorting domain-containing protein [Paraglaciecola sp. L1A13]